ncbi:rod shape-determining protein MreC [Massilia sp. Dwa41.01b]|uniref:rod shape-determining protein MreC n=1 Tax=Massilia sp. Dwa41.01b TaxID=2709302 RepID=UPI001600BCA3|nr:rod shape-determining protein MreC [Massilia sp. Dwa41.01b]QNA87843.1 rod shape-determining protein MreC [Massilia sp. Dwa41.01b]
MEYSPPPLFKQGAPARVKVTVFAFVSLALLLIDARMHLLGTVRQVAATVLYPLQMAALMPRDAMFSMGDYFSSISSLQKEVRELKNQQVAQAQSMQLAQLQMAENAHLRRLLEAREHLPVQSIMGEILYDARDPSTRRIVLDRGTRNGVQLGLPVIDNAGVIGQVTRVFPFTSEVTLLTDRDQAIPVQVLRSGLRSIAYGRGRSGLLDLRFVAPDADIQVGDVIVTSGLDGMYPAGLAVAKVVQVEKVAAGAFGRVTCQPLGGVDRNRQLLIVMSQAARAARPQDLPVPPAHGAARRNLPKMEPVPTPPLAPAPLPAQGAPTQPAAGVPAAVPAAAPATAPTTAPAGAAPATAIATPGANTAPRTAAPRDAARLNAAPAAATTQPVQPALRKEGAP